MCGVGILIFHLYNSETVHDRSVIDVFSGSIHIWTQALVVQSMASLRKSIEKSSFSLLVHIKSSPLILLLKTCKELCTAKGPHIFSAKMTAFLRTIRFIF